LRIKKNIKKKTLITHKNIKLFNFYYKAKNLRTNHVLQFMSMIWSRLQKTYRKAHSMAKRATIVSIKDCIHAFPVLKNYLLASFVQMRQDPRLIHFFKANPFDLTKQKKAK